MAETVGHSIHTLPGEVNLDGVIMGKELANVETLKKLEKGEGPEYEVLVATYPRSGTARIMEIAWLLMNDIDVDKAKEISQTARYLFLDLCDPDFKTTFRGTVPLKKEKYQLAKSHFQYRVLEEHTKRDTKIIVGMRNPKDNLVSLYHFYRMHKGFGNFTGTFSEFFTLVKDKHTAYGDFFDFNVGWWSIKNRPNTMYVFFEDIAEDPVREVRKIANFLDKKISDDDAIKIVNWTNFGNMQNEKSLNYEVVKHLDFKVSPYMRKGTVGDWKNYFTEEEEKYIDEQYEKTCVPLGLKFRFEL